MKIFTVFIVYNAVSHYTCIYVYICVCIYTNVWVCIGVHTYISLSRSPTISNSFCLYLVAMLFSFIFGHDVWLASRDISSPARDGTQATAVKMPSPNHWTAGKFPMLFSDTGLQ